MSEKTEKLLTIYYHRHYEAESGLTFIFTTSVPYWAIHGAIDNGKGVDYTNIVNAMKIAGAREIGPSIFIPETGNADTVIARMTRQNCIMRSNSDFSEACENVIHGDKIPVPDTAPAVKILLHTASKKAVMAVIESGRLEEGDPAQQAVILFHKILDAKTGKGLHRVETLLSMDADVLAEYGVRFEPIKIDGFINLRGLVTIPYAPR